MPNFRKKSIFYYLCNPSKSSGVSVTSKLPLNFTTTEFRVAVSFCAIMNSFSSPKSNHRNCLFEILHIFTTTNRVGKCGIELKMCLLSTWLPVSVDRIVTFGSHGCGRGTDCAEAVCFADVLPESECETIRISRQFE